MKKEPYRTYIIIALEIVFLYAIFVLPAFADEAIESTNEANSSGGTAIGYTSGGDIRLAAGVAFTPTITGTIESVVVSVTVAGGSPSDGLVVELQAGSSLPDNTVIESTDTITSIASSCTNAATNDRTFTFDSPAPVTAGTKYWIVVKRAGAQSDSNFYRLCGSGSAGAPYYEAHKYGSGWTDETSDAQSRISLTVIEGEGEEPPAATSTDSVTSSEAQAQQNLFNGFVIFFIFMVFPIWLFRKR